MNIYVGARVLVKLADSRYAVPADIVAIHKRDITIKTDNGNEFDIVEFDIIDGP